MASTLTLVLEDALTDAHRRMDYTGLPSEIFTDPALASAGMTEAEAKAAGHEVLLRVLNGDARSRPPRRS